MNDRGKEARPGAKSVRSAPQTCCSGQPVQTISHDVASRADIRKLASPWICGTVSTSVGHVPAVRTKLEFSDRLGSWKARWGINRMGFRIMPDLYAAGNPTDKSPVMVSANYKMSFDRLRSQLSEIDAWILVLDTRGINVWCAAGKGTFGTDELVRQVESVGLKDIVSHRKLIVPQLGATGVSAHKVKERCGFRVVYGPVRANDIPAFMEAGMRATPEMRQVRFSFRDRVVLIPVELVAPAKYALLAAVALLMLSGFGPSVFSFERLATYGIASAIFLIVTFVVGTTFPQALLPWLPGRSFSIKGMWVGLLLAAGLAWFASGNPETVRSQLSIAAWFGISPAVASFMTMNFTGSSTYTSLSGVLREMRIAIPIQIAIALAGLGLWTAGLFV